MPQQDQLFSNMLFAARDWLRARTAQQICRLTDASFDGSALHLETLGQSVCVTVPDYQLCPQLSQWHTLTLLHYLARGDGTPLSGTPITFAQHKDGLIRGGGFDRDAETTIREKLGILPPEELQRRCLALGARIIPSNADLCAEFLFLPRYPVWLKVWFADDEFPASGRLLLDAMAEHYLSIEDAVTVGGLILERLLTD